LMWDVGRAASKLQLQAQSGQRSARCPDA